jgi:hypothetical protein
LGGREEGRKRESEMEREREREGEERAHTDPIAMVNSAGT